MNELERTYFSSVNSFGRWQRIIHPFCTVAVMPHDAFLASQIGAFKIRGATNAILQLSPEEKDRGVITHSSGNHAQVTYYDPTIAAELFSSVEPCKAIALAAKTQGLNATIVMPNTAPQVTSSSCVLLPDGDT